MPPDIITMEIEVDAPAAGPDTLGVDDLQATPSPTVRRRLGRFTVLGTLGRGGMGTVLEAYDDTLARTLALKLLHGRVVENRQERLLREAQALAQLSHPNVVQVYEVGMVEDQMFIAMELVEGENLRLWQRRRRPWRQVVEVYVQAGRGLAAAHAEDLIHRDFKPENCIIGDNGRVCVLDFGLARGSKTVDDPTVSLSDSVEDSSLHHRLTQSGKVLGTLSYLPLQQLMGRPADAKSDQFSFCVSLYEALYGMLPFKDESLTTLIEAQQKGELQSVPRGSSVPRRLREVLLRGLSQDPADRWPSMDLLLEALEGLLAPRRRFRLAAAGATLVLGFSAGAVVVAGLREEPCANPEVALEGTWGPNDRAAVQEAFLGSGHLEAKRLLARVETQLDQYTAEWVGMVEDSCRANLATGRQPEPHLDRRMSCLRRHRGRLRATIDALAEVSTPAEALDRTILPFKLPVLDVCADLEGIESRVPLPDDPALRERVEDVRREIDQANTLGEAGALPVALGVARRAVDRARSTDHAPVLAEALETLGRLHGMSRAGVEAETVLQDAIMVAARAHDDSMAARSWTSLVYAVMIQGELDRALSFRFAATAAVDRSGDDVARGWLLNNVGTLHGQRGEYEQARVHLRQALDIKQSTLGPEHFDVGIAWFNLGNALVLGGELDEGRRAHARARAIFSATVGELHPYVAFVETGLGHLSRKEGRLAEAVTHHRQALEIRERALGPHDVTVGTSLEHIAAVQHELGELGEAAEALRRALEIYEHGPGSAQAGACALTLSDVERERGRRKQAREMAERAMASLEAHGDPETLARARFAWARLATPDSAEEARARTRAEQAHEVLSGEERTEVEQWLRSHPVPPLPEPEASP